MVLSALCNIVYPCYHVTHKYALTWDSQLHSLVQGQLGITSADRVRRLWRQHVSSSFFLSFFLSFWQHVFFTYFPTSDFDQTWSMWPLSWPLLRLRQWWGQRSRWGHWGQKCHFHQKGIKSYRILSSDAWLMHMHKLDPLYKSYGPKNSSGVIWGHGGQKVIFTKKASSPSEYVALARNLCTCISLIPSTKVMVLKIHPGSFGVTGVKRSFSLKML